MLALVPLPVPHSPGWPLSSSSVEPGGARPSPSKQGGKLVLVSGSQLCSLGKESPLQFPLPRLWLAYFRSLADVG